jgi:hypothetical protein
MYVGGLNMLYQNNDFYDFPAGRAISMRGHVGQTEGSTPAHRVINNTFGPDTNVGPIHHGLLGYYRASGTTGAKAIYIDNNVFLNDDDRAMSQNRDMYNPGGTIYFRNNRCVSEDGVIKSNPAWYGNIVQSGNTFNLSPGDFNLQDYGSQDYRITENSTILIDNGLTTYAPSDDYEANARDSQPDIGAYEYLGDIPVMPGGPAIPVNITLANCTLFPGSGGEGSGAECDLCPEVSAGSGNILCESYSNGTGFFCSYPAWTEAGDGVNEDHTPGGTYGCTDSDNENLLVSYDHDSNPDATAVATISSNDDVYARFNFRVADADLDDGDYFAIYAMHLTATTCTESSISKSAMLMRLYNNSGTLQIASRHRKADGTYLNSQDGTPLTVTVGTWYTAQVTWESGTAAKVVWSELDGSNEETVVDSSDVYSTNVNCVWLPATNSHFNYLDDAGDTLDLEIDRVKIDNSSMPAGCSL